MAVELNSRPTKYNEYPRSIRRQGAFPPYDDMIFFSLGEEGTTDQNTARGYARYNPTAYVGQTLTVIDKAKGIFKDYHIVDVIGTLKEKEMDLIGLDDPEVGDKGWTGDKIKDYIAKYVEENGGGGGTYVPPAVGFEGIGTLIKEVGEQYSLISFKFRYNTPNTLKSDIVIRQGLYDYTLPKDSVTTENTINVGSLHNTGGGLLSINGYLNNTDEIRYDFTATMEDKAGPLTATASYIVRGYYYAYFGANGANAMNNTLIVSDTFNVSAGNDGRKLCSANTFDLTITTSGNDYIWLCLPSDKILSSVKMNGYDVTDAFTIVSNLTGVRSHTGSSITNYHCYRSALQAANTVKITVTIA